MFVDIIVVSKSWCFFGFYNEIVAKLNFANSFKSEQIIRMKSKFYAENRFHQSLAQFLHAVFVFVFVFLCAKILLWLYVQFSLYIALYCTALHSGIALHFGTSFLFEQFLQKILKFAFA